MNFNEFNRFFWNHFIEIEKEILSIEQYISFDEKNLKTFSNKFLSLYQVLGSEIEVVSRCFCEELGDNQLEYFSQYKIKIFNAYPKIKGEKVYIKRLSKIVIPFEDKMDWWTFYNKSKHDRIDKQIDGAPYFNQCNLENILTAFSALYILELYLYKEIVSKYGDSDDYILEKQKLVILERLNYKPNCEWYEFDNIKIRH